MIAQALAFHAPAIYARVELLAECRRIVETQMEAKTRANSIITTSVNEALTEVTFTVKDVGAVTLHLNRLNDLQRAMGLVHGCKQKVCDAAALSRDIQGGREVSATPANKFAAMREQVEHLEGGGAWNRAGGGGSGDTVMLVNVLRELYPHLEDTVVVAKVTGMSPAQRKAMLVSEKCAQVVQRMQAERVKGVDTEQLFAELDSI